MSMTFETDSDAERVDAKIAEQQIAEWSKRQTRSATRGGKENPPCDCDLCICDKWPPCES